MMDEMAQRPVWTKVGRYLVFADLFLDLVFTSRCNCSCPWCIARTKQFAPENDKAWEQALRDAFRLFPIRSAIVLGGEPTVDPRFFEKLELLSRTMEGTGAQKLILTTNGVRLAEEEFLSRLLDTRVDAVNLSRMHYDQAENDRIFGRPTLTRRQIFRLGERLRGAGKTLRLNVNVWRGNLDAPEEMDRFTDEFSGSCSAIKFTPLMETGMFGTEDSVTEFSKNAAIPEDGIAALWDSYAARHRLVAKAEGVLGYVNYADVDAGGQRVLLKYAQVEDKYDRDTHIPTLKLYPNGCLSNEWSYTKDVRAGAGGR